MGCVSQGVRREMVDSVFLLTNPEGKQDRTSCKLSFIDQPLLPEVDGL